MVNLALANQVGIQDDGELLSVLIYLHDTGSGNIAFEVSNSTQFKFHKIKHAMKHSLFWIVDWVSRLQSMSMSFPTLS